MIKVIWLAFEDAARHEQTQLLADQLVSQGDASLLTTLPTPLHFAPTQPEYYAEVAARVGVEPDEILLISLEPSHLAAAQIVGLATLSAPTPAAALDALQACLQQADWRVAFPSAPLTRTLVLAELRGNIGALHGMLTDTTPIMWHQHPIEGEWSIVQILCHLLTAETQPHRERLLRIANEENPFIVETPPPSPQLPICHDNAQHVAALWTEARQTTLAWLESLPDTTWHRRARHSIFGLTRFVEMAHFTAQHDRLHLNQLCQTIGKCSDS